MRKLTLNTSLCSALTLLSVVAFAQPHDEDKTVATLEVGKGTIMTSKGGEFVTASTGEKLIKEERLMVAKESSATVVYNDHCKRTYDEPGVYKIDEDCKAVAFWGIGTAALIVAAAAGGEEIISYESRKNATPTINATGSPPISR